MTDTNDASNWGRLYTAMVTPMREDGAIDVEQAQTLASALIQSGSEGVVVAGTTGESPTLSHEEERVLFREMLPVVHDLGATLIAGTGSNSTATAIEASEQAAKIGVDGLLQVVPYYNKPSQEGLYQHFRAVADAVDTPVMLYNVPGRTGSNMSAATTVRLAEDCPNINGVKEASGDLEQIAEIIRTAPKHLRVWSGNDGDNLGDPRDGRLRRRQRAIPSGQRPDQGDVRRLGGRRYCEGGRDPGAARAAGEGDVPGRKSRAGQVGAQRSRLPRRPAATAIGRA